MNITRQILNLKFALLVAACGLLATQTGRAQLLFFHVDINTAALTGTLPSGNYSLDFNLTDGGTTTTGPTSVTVNNISLTGGSAIASTVNAVGQAYGNIAAGIAMNDSAGNVDNDINEAFTNGTSDIQFDVRLKPNASGTTADQFAITINDNTGSEIYTTAGDGLNLLEVPITSTNPAALESGIFAYQSTAPSPTGVTVTVSDINVIPEPSTWALMFLGAGLLVAFRFRTRKA